MGDSDVKTENAWSAVEWAVGDCTVGVHVAGYGKTESVARIATRIAARIAAPMRRIVSAVPRDMEAVHVAVAAAVMLAAGHMRPAPARRLRVTLLMPTMVVRVHLRPSRRGWRAIGGER